MDLLRRSRIRVFLLLACLLVAGGLRAGAAEPSLEHVVKVSFLYKFIPFVSWPPGSQESSAPFKICIVGNGDPFGQTFDLVLQGQQIEGRAVVARRMAVVTAAHDCAVLFVAGSPDQSVSDALKAVEGTPVLTVTDAAISSQARGVVHFVLRDGRVRFMIDTEAAKTHGLNISSKLLSLAVKDEG